MYSLGVAKRTEGIDHDIDSPFLGNLPPVLSNLAGDTCLSSGRAQACHIGGGSPCEEKCFCTAIQQMKAVPVLCEKCQLKPLVSACSGTSVDNIADFGMLRIIHGLDASSGVQRIEEGCGATVLWILQEHADVMQSRTGSCKYTRASGSRRSERSLPVR